MFDVLDLNPFYNFGVEIWNLMLSLIGYTSAQTPEGFSGLAWNYAAYVLYPWFFTIGATLMNLFFLIGFMRQASNLKQNFTLEVFVECCIKVLVGNALMISGVTLMRVILEMAAEAAGSILGGNHIVFSQADMDVGGTLFHLFLGVLFFAVCVTCSATIFLTVYGRFLYLYLMVVTAPVALSTIPGGPGISHTASSWCRAFLSKAFGIVAIAAAIAIASKMCNAIDFGGLSGLGEGLDGAIQAVQSMATMVLLTAAVKGTDTFMRRSFAL